MSRLARRQHGIVARRQLLALGMGRGAAGDGMVLSHRSAARLWRLMSPGDEWVDVTCPLVRSVERKGIVGHSSALADDEWVVWDGIPVTSPFRTVFDLAAVLGLRELERVWHEAEVKELRDRGRG